MPIDYSKIPTADLLALKSGRYTQVSTPTLEMLQGASQEQDPRAAFLAANPQDPNVSYPMADHTPDSTWDKVNKGLSFVADNLPKEIPRLAQEMVTVPVNSAIKSAYGLAAIPVAAIQGADAATEMIKNRPQVSGPMEPSMTGRAMSAGIGAINEALPDNTAGDIGRGAIEAGTDIAGLIGGAQVLGKAGKIAGNVTTKAAVKAIGTKPETLMESALKQSTTLPQSTRARNVQTALEGEYVPNKKGAAKLESDIGNINAQIADVIDSAKQAGDTINVNDVVTRLDGLKTKANETPMWEKNNAAIDEVINGLKTNPNVVNGELPVDVAQNMKVKIGQDVKYGQFTTFEGEGLKGIARGIKEELAAKFPELADLNAKDSTLYSLQKQLDRAVNRIGNRESIGIAPAIKMGAGAAAGTTGAIIGALTGLIEHPAIAPRLAINLYKARKGAISHLQARQIVANRLQEIAANIRNMAAVEAGQSTQGGNNGQGNQEGNQIP